MQSSFGDKNHVTWPNLLRFAIVLEGYFPLDHDNELRMLNLVRWIGRTANR